MSIVSISSKIRDHSSIHDKHFTGTGKDLDTKTFAESIELSFGVAAAGSHEMAYIMQERVGPYPSSHHLPSAHGVGRELSNVFGTFGFNELSDFWGDIRLDSHEMGIATMLAPQNLGWNEASTSCSKSGYPMTTAASVEDGRQLAQYSSGRYSIPSFGEMSGGVVNHFECPGLLQPEQSCRSARPVAPCVPPADKNSTLIDRDDSRSSKSEDAGPLSCSLQPEISVKTVSPSLQPSTSQTTRFHCQSMLPRCGVQDVAVLKHLTDNVIDSISSGTRQRSFGQQGPSVSMSRSPEFHGRSQPGELGIAGKGKQISSGNLNLLKLKQKSKEQSTLAPRKYRRRRAINGTDMRRDVEVDSVPRPLDHVQRERQRRDLMTSKIVALELLLPKCPKRDRVSIVYDTIELLKKLEHEVAALQKRLHETKLRRSSSLVYRQPPHPPKSFDRNPGPSGTCFSNGEVIKRLGTYMKPIVSCTQPMSGTKSRPTQRSPMIASTQSVGNGDLLDHFVEFQIQLDDTLTIQEEKLLKCRCRKNYLSSMMGVVDEFQLDIISCSIMKLSGYFLCVMGLKTRRGKETNSTAAQFAVRLRSVVDIDVGREARAISLSGAQISETHQIEPKSRHFDQGVATQFDSPTFGF